MFVTTCTHGQVLGQCQGYWCDHTYCKSLAGTHHLKEGNSHCNWLLRGSHTHCPPVYVSVTRLDWEGKVWNRIAHSVIPIQLFASLWPQKCCEQCVTVRQEEYKCTSAKVHKCSSGTEIVWNTRGGMCSGRSTGWNTGVWNESNWALSVYSLWKCVSLIQRHNTNRDRELSTGPVSYGLGVIF